MYGITDEQLEISIHALHEESDGTPIQHGMRATDFNPRSP